MHLLFTESCLSLLFGFNNVRASFRCHFAKKKNNWTVLLVQNFLFSRKIISYVLRFAGQFWEIFLSNLSIRKYYRKNCGMLYTRYRVHERSIYNTSATRCNVANICDVVALFHWWHFNRRPRSYTRKLCDRESVCSPPLNMLFVKGWNRGNGWDLVW